MAKGCFRLCRLTPTKTIVIMIIIRHCLQRFPNGHKNNYYFGVKKLRKCVFCGSDRFNKTCLKWTGAFCSYRWRLLKGQQWPRYCITLLLYHSTIVLLYYCITLMLYYSNAVLLYYCISLLLYHSTAVLLYYCITLLLYHSNAVLP